MAMGIVSDEDYLARFRSPTKQGAPLVKESHLQESHPVAPKGAPVEIPVVQINDINKGRGEEVQNVPPEVREMIARATINDEGSAKEIAGAFGVSPSSVSAYKVGAHSTTSYHEPDTNLSSALAEHKATISRKARMRLLTALEEITPERLSAAKTRDLASIAKDMSSIVKDMEPSQVSTTNQNNVQFVFMAPKVKEIEDYRIINVPD